MLNDPEFKCLGGDNKFMNIFINEAGGVEYLKQRFLKFAT